MMKRRVLFICTGNSCRSQMAEGMLRTMADQHFDVFSAGSKPTGHIHPLAIETMCEIGMDISGQSSKSVDQFKDQSFDFVITVCDAARETCPVFTGVTKQLHWSFEDPAQATGTPEQKLRIFRRIRDEIRHRLRRFVEANTGGN
jgi:arsenate reductase